MVVSKLCFCQKMFYYFSIILIVFCFDFASLKNVRKSKFLIGRIPPGSFEYPELNGYFSPKKSVRICESDPACGGFTFKGTPKISNQVFEVYFFHFVPKDLFEKSSKIDQFYHWTSYRVQSRKYSKLKNFKIKNLENIHHGVCLKQRLVKCIREV